MPEIRVRISGWTYPGWRGKFYPDGLPRRRELEFASRQVSSIEINGSFYSLQSPESYLAWYEATPADFVFAVKGGRFITHVKRLKEAVTPVANFFASGILRLREKLGPILWQLPPSVRYDRSRLEAFFGLLPRGAAAAEALARKHDTRLNRRAWTESAGVGKLRHALEVRHGSFENTEFVEILREHDIALVVADTAGKSGAHASRVYLSGVPRPDRFRDEAGDIAAVVCAMIMMLVLPFLASAFEGNQRLCPAWTPGTPPGDGCAPLVTP